MTELARYEAPQRDTDDWATMLPAIGDLAGKIAGTNFVPTPLRGKSAEVAACILTGREIGVGPMESLQKIHIIEGRPSLSAELMRSLVFKAGHQLRVVESTPSKCVVAGRRRGDEEWTQVSWSIEDARKAGVDGKAVWKKHPRQMLSARATSELCRLIFPDALGGISYTPDEIEDMEPEPTVTVSRAESPKRTVRRAQVAAEPAEPPLDEPVEAEVVDVPLPADDVPDAITSQQLKKLGLLMRERDMTDRTEALEFVAGVVGRPIESRNDLTKAEASQVIDALEAMPATTSDPALPDDPWGNQ